MKNILKVTILFCIIIGCFVVPSFADDFDNQPLYKVNSTPTISDITSNGLEYLHNGNDIRYAVSNVDNTFMFSYGSNKYAYGCADRTGYIYYNYFQTVMNMAINNYNAQSNLYYSYSQFYSGESVVNIPNFATLQDGLNAVRYYLDNPPPVYTKNLNVDEFIANTMISMGVKFDTPAYALSYASDAWDWCIDETNMESANPFDEWNIDSFVSYCNAQSNNYLNWYNGYKVSEDVTNALGEYIRQNIQLLSGLPAGITSLTSSYLPIYHYGSGFNSGASSPSAQTFYPAQTITYFNGEYVNEVDDISTSQFLYTPPDVRRFLGYPGSSTVITPSTPTGTGTITDDPNNPSQKNITINFPALDWLADAIKSILDFLRDAFTTLADLLTQLLDAILGLFSDAFAGLADFGQGIIDFLQSVFAGLSTLLNGYVPSDLVVIIACFIALNFGVGLITFVLKGH